MLRRASGGVLLKLTLYVLLRLQLGALFQAAFGIYQRRNFMGALIGKVTVDPANPTAGQSVFVQVCNPSGQPLTDPSVAVNIMGVPASARYLQFATPGTRKLIVHAVQGAVTDSQEVSINVAASTNGAANQILQVKQVAGQPYAATFTVGTPPRLRPALARAVTKSAAAKAATAHAATAAPAAPKTATAKPAPASYKWDFGDGQTATTQSPTVAHDYFPAIQAGQLTHSFHVTCTISQDNMTIKRTLVLHSAYGLCRQAGTIVPPVTGDAYATFQHVGYSGSMVVHNLETSPITLDSMACIPLSKDATAALPAPKFTKMQVPVVLAANSATGVGVYITQAQLLQGGIAGANVTGFTVYYSGTMKGADGKAMPVRFSYAFCISLADSKHNSFAAPAPVAWDMNAALQAVTASAMRPKATVSKQGGQTIDPVTHTVAIALSTGPRDATALAQVRMAVQAGLTSIAQKAGNGAKAPAPAAPKAGPAVEVRVFNPSDAPPVAAGNECYPDDISDAEAATAGAQHLVCQATGQTVTETIPASFQNAQQGDVILSPAPVGGGDMIAAMFSALTPPQHHGHSGIMTNNFFEITHCTASPDRIAANLNTDALGIPTSLQATMLQYGWPGSLTQTVDDAINTITLNDPSNKPYQFSSFNPGSIGENFEIIPPLVVKPLPENEATVRPTLRKVADTARSKGAQYDSKGNLKQKGGCYYSFYSYTKPEVALGFTDAAGADAGWAQGMSPAVCSGFVWLCMKENNIPLVTKDEYEKLADFSTAAQNGGAQVGAATRDGLIYYPAAERLQGAEALQQMFMNQALDQEDGLGTIPGINDAIAGPLADQLLNMFAFGKPDMPGSSAWQNPGDGNAVSPDNIVWWNTPYFGYPEPLQFMPEHTERYTTSQWKKIVATGTIKGTVRLNGAPVPKAHVWVYMPNGDTYTQADGSFTLENIPTGAYTLSAEATITTNGVTENYTNAANQHITLAASPPLVENIALQPPPVDYRRFDFTYAISCDHGDANPFNTHGVQKQPGSGSFSHQLFVNPGHTTDSYTYSYDYAGGGYFHIDYNFTVSLDAKGQIELKVVATMYNSGDNNAVATQAYGPVKIDAGKSLPPGTQLTISHSGTGYHNGPAILTFGGANNQQTG
jgi:hypothetical protein